MSPVNNDPSSGTAGGGMPLTRKELRARERFLATQNHNVVPVPEATPGEAAASTDREPELPRPVPAVQPAPVEPPAPAAPPGPASKPAAPPVPTEQPVSLAPIPADEPTPASDDESPSVETPGEPHPAEPDHGGNHLDGAEPHEVEGHHHSGYVDPDHTHDVAGHGPHTDHFDEHHADDLHHDEHHADDLHHDEHHADDLHHEEHHHDLIAPVEQTASAKAAVKKARRRRRVLALLITLGVFVAAIAIGAQFLKPLLGMDKVTDYPGPGTGSVNITVPEGSGPKAVAVALVENKVVADADAFVKEFLNDGGELSPGEFTFRTEMKNSDAVDVLVNKDSSKVMYFALSAGLRINESLEAISKGSGISMQELNALNQAPAQFGIPSKAKNLEGFLAPGEYRFPLGTPAKDIIQKLATTTLDELKSQGITEPGKQYDTVTIASIVQAEGGQADYGNVAGAIYNRLKPNNVETSGLIQSDATVTYGLGKKSFHLTEEEKADKSNTYNTYANVGLPAGPIGSPGKTAIDAAAKPTQNDYMYWVTINLDSKETKFSKTLAEHNTYVELYNAWCQANPGRCV
ncbi:endolytic transglycosylase MltG [Paenarthrobacter sp. NPDC091669]|uniref:endolytic transglycosylase MltG n=1 Tax=Paenarthrobacter sp. NPDC091669 TaxID=3364384 RepID=UPI00380CBB12